jgi:hypothetical protein
VVVLPVVHVGPLWVPRLSRLAAGGPEACRPQCMHSSGWQAQRCYPVGVGSCYCGVCFANPPACAPVGFHAVGVLWRCIFGDGELTAWGVFVCVLRVCGGFGGGNCRGEFCEGRVDSAQCAGVVGWCVSPWWADTHTRRHDFVRRGVRRVSRLVCLAMSIVLHTLCDGPTGYLSVAGRKLVSWWA